MDCIAYVLICADPGVTRKVFDHLEKVDSLIGRCEVMGPYDIVLKLSAPSLSEFSGVIAEQIRTIPGVASTTTLVAFPAGTGREAASEAGESLAPLGG